jgi:hypothetical protein
MGASQTFTESRQQEVREELNRLLESPTFRTSKRCREFLQYIVDKTVSGPNGSLKERSIGIDLFGLPQDFDTSQHTIVRVTATETRKKLAQYYHHAEANPRQSVRIDLPPGSYNAEFTWIEQPASVALTPETSATPDPPTVAPMAEVPPSSKVVPPISRRWIMAGGGIGLLATTISAWQWRSARNNPAATGEMPNAIRPVALSAPSATGLPPGPVRIGVGLANPYLDRNGQTWDVDRFFTGGRAIARPAERVARTLDPDLYRHARLGDFAYDIPLAKGTYELHLHFAETGLSDFISAESSGEGQRVFRVAVNGKTLLDYFDVVADAAGANISDERVFRNISPAEDGMLHLTFSPIRGSAMLSGIEIFQAPAGKALPLRIRSGWPTSWRDSAGRQWRADSYFLGGNALVRRTNPARDSEPASPDHALYANERWGHFSYALPVSDGKYQVTLKFCEGHLGPRNTGIGGVGSRVFDVYCNGVALLRDFDIVREAGGEGRPLDRVFSAIRPNAQGKILLTFVPNVGMACVNGIEVVEH